MSFTMAQAGTTTMGEESAGFFNRGKQQEEEEEEEEGEIDDGRAKAENDALDGRRAEGRPLSRRDRPEHFPIATSHKKRPQLDNVVYIPPAKRRQLAQERLKEQEKLQDTVEGPTGGNATEGSSSERLQRATWQEQRRVIHGSINRLNAGSIKPLIQDLFAKVNLIRFRGVLTKSVLLAAVSSPAYSNVYAALISVVNAKLPEVGELCVKRAILAFRRHYKRREKSSCISICIFMAHLFHQGVIHELIILQLLSVLLDGNPTDDSVEVAIQLLQVSGQALLEVSPAGVRACLERLRSLLHDGQLNSRVEYKMEQLLKQRKNSFRDQPRPIPEDLDLIERDDQITFEISLDDEEIEKEEDLDVFSMDPNYEEHEQEWTSIRKEILGEDDGESETDSNDDDDDDDSSDDEGDADDDDEQNEIPDQELAIVPASSKAMTTVIQDLTEEDLVHLRRTIYLTIMSSATFEECTHKLNKIDIPVGREQELINMLIECCSQERTFLRYYGLISARFCLLDNRWRDAFMESFAEQYGTIHRLETNKLRNVAKLFAHLLHTDAMPWSVLSIIHLNEDETTSSSRIFIKIVIQEMAESMGIAKIKKRFEVTREQDPEAAGWYAGMFPKDNVRNTRYAINFFTSIGLGPLTDDLREFLKNAPKLILAQAQQQQAALAKQREDESDESSSVSSTSSSSSNSVSSTSTSSSSSRSSSSGSYSSYSSRRRGRSSRRRKGRGRRYSSSSRSTSTSESSKYSSSPGSRGRNGRRRASRSPPKHIGVRKRSGGDSETKDRSRSGSRSLHDKDDKKRSQDALRVGKDKSDQARTRSRSDSASRSEHRRKGDRENRSPNSRKSPSASPPSGRKGFRRLRSSLSDRSSSDSRSRRRRNKRSARSRSRSESPYERRPPRRGDGESSSRSRSANNSRGRSTPSKGRDRSNEDRNRRRFDERGRGNGRSYSRSSSRD